MKWMDVLVCVGRELSGPCLQGYLGELGYRSQGLHWNLEGWFGGAQWAEGSVNFKGALKVWGKWDPSVN